MLVKYRYPGQYVYCSEQSLSGPGQSAGDNKNLERQESEQDSTQLKVLEEWTTHTSYEIGLEIEKAALETLSSHNEHQEQTVNALEAEVEETKSDPQSDTVLVALEPEPHPDPQADVEQQTDTQDNAQEVPLSSTPEPVPAQGQVSPDVPAPAETLSDPSAAQPNLDSHPATSPDEAEHTPTSQSAGQTHTGAVRVASAGDELPVDNLVFAEHSDSQCRVIPPELATCENPPFGSPLLSVDEAGLEDQQPDHSQSSGSEAEVQSTPGPVDQEQQQLQQQQEAQDLEEGLTDLDQEGNTSQHNEPQVGSGNIAREPDPPVPRKEDIPTFDEWKKQVMEVEKEKSQSLHTSSSGSPHPVKKVQKNFKNNYASVECGAKILSANNEAKSTSAILMENMDLYMLNPCSNKIWFVIELCEPIQVKQLDIANFELFSSTPKDFLVSISDRYPTNKWVKLGTFHARDERIVQSFPLDEQLYAKYVKVELLSHFGSEHFCPLSLIRVFGTSMVEEYEEIADSQYPSERLEYLDEDFDAILNMVNNIAANVLGGKPELEGGTVAGVNTTAEVEEKKESTEVAPKPAETPPDPAVPEPAEPDPPAAQEDCDISNDSSTPSPSSTDSQEDRQIVTLWDSQTYCPFSSFSSLSLSCMATLPELLHRWCSARLAKERQRSVKRKQLSSQTQTDVNPPSLTHPPPLIPVPVPTPLKEAPPLTEKAPEPELPVKAQHEGKASGEVPTTHPNTDTQTPEVNILLEPSRTATIPPHSFSDIHSSLTSPTPSHEEKLPPPIKDAALDPIPTPSLPAVSIPETQHASSATPTLTFSPPPQPGASETASPGAVVPPAKEQPVQLLPTASRPEDLIPPLTELPTALPPTDTETVKPGADSGDSQRQNVQASQTNGEQGDSLTHTGDRVEDSVDLFLLSTNGNGNVHRTATDFYAELQNGGDYNGGAMTGNAMLLNGGAVHGSSQKESVFMRLNNRIKALEMNMSLSSRYLEELSQRYRKQMEEMQRAFNKTIIKLQNTSRIAEEQDQRQTDSIQILHSQLENVSKLMLNLTDTVSQLQREVSDRQSYLVVSLVLCLTLGLLLCLQCCRSPSPSPNPIAAALPKSNHYPSPKRCFSSYDDMSLKRRVTCPLVRSKSFHLSSTEVGPDDLYIVEPLRFSPEKKKKRCKSKSLDKVDLLKLADPCAPLTNGALNCNETSSCSSSTHSEESYTSRLPPPSPIRSSTDLCNGHSLPFSLQQSPTKSRQEKRSMKRRKSRQMELHLQQLMKGNKEISVGTIGVTAVTGHV
ncbi:SUN domain containing ossification factor [Dissostichus eleginoides]|uniref:SUN domain containing ossification factor n=1 Tax=Dissostichus eleginoides TaxID=100907 RepID=A0AAD9CAA1_DISEL|nr:SUN domain containing ossification factor [Dissostichus eleginoides]